MPEKNQDKKRNLIYFFKIAMRKRNKKLVECPYCGKTRFYKNWSEFKKHKKDCPERFRNPQERFKTRILKQKNKINL